MSLKMVELKVYYKTIRGMVQALDGMTIDLPDGEIMGLAGESGCGKSTLSNALILLKPPMELVGGHVELDGTPLPIGNFSQMKAFRYKLISIIPQYAMNAMNPTVKIGRFIRSIIESRGISFSKVTNALYSRFEIVGLSKKILDLYPIELSGGMKQRVVMVIATLLNPSLLLADEITSALDVSTQKAVAKLLVEFRNQGFVKSVIFVTHDVSVLYQIADRILIMYAGKLAELGPTETIINQPCHPYTKLLVSSMPEVGVTFEKTPLHGIPGQPPLLLNPPKGCRFQERCPLAYKQCSEDPPVEEIQPGHQVACWKARETDD